MPSVWPLANEPVALAADELHVWAVPLDAAGRAWDAHLPALSPDERERADRFKSDDLRRRFVVTRSALRTLLGRYLNVPAAEVAFDYDAAGKPRLQGENPAHLTFNLAHSGELALIAVAAGCDVGVDVERLRAVDHWREIAQRYFHPAEVEAVVTTNSQQPPMTFFRCWTAKEAVLKALGTGLSQPLNSFRVPCDEPEGSWTELPVHRQSHSSRCWLQPLAPGDEYVAAVACLNTMRRARCWTLQP